MGEIVKKYMPAIILLFVVAIIWGGLVFFFDTQESGSNVDVGIYKSSLKNNFDNETLEDMDERVMKTLPVSPKEFINLKKKD